MKRIHARPGESEEAARVAWQQAYLRQHWRTVLVEVLVCLVIFAGLFLIKHCVKKCRKKHRVTRQIRVAVHGSGPPARVVVVSGECSICLGEFLDGERVRVLPNCNHEFHVLCIDKWLALHSSCPNCRHSVVAGSLQRLPENIVRQVGLTT